MTNFDFVQKYQFQIVRFIDILIKQVSFVTRPASFASFLRLYHKRPPVVRLFYFYLILKIKCNLCVFRSLSDFLSLLLANVFVTSLLAFPQLVAFPYTSYSHIIIMCALLFSIFDERP